MFLVELLAFIMYVSRLLFIIEDKQYNSKELEKYRNEMILLFNTL